MRGDLIEAQIVLPHPPRRVWEVLADPELYPRFIRDLTWCRHLGGGQRKGARYEVRLCAEGDRVVSAIWEIRDYRPGQRLALAGGGRDGFRASVNLEDAQRGGTALRLLLSMPDGSSGALSAGSVRKRLQAAGRMLNDHLAGAFTARAKADGDGASLLTTASTLVQAGVLRPDRPDRTIKQLRALQQWGATLVGGYRGAAARDPAATAVRDERGSVTFATLEDRSTRLAHALARWGVGAGSTVATMCRNHGSYLEALLACGKLGAHVAMLNTGLSAEQVADVLAAHQPVAVLADDEFADRIVGVPGDCPLISTWQEPGAAASHARLDELIDATTPAPIRPPEQPGRVIVLTSGTTGTPKGARRPTPKGLSDAAIVYSRIPLRVGDRIHVAAPLFHTWGFAALQLAMPLRAMLTLRRRFDPEDALRTIARSRCTAMFVVPVMLQRIMELPRRVRARYDTSTLRIVASSGSALPGSLVEAFTDAFGDVLYNFYGSTEVSWASIADPTDLRAAPTTAGRCPLGTRLEIRDARGKPVAPGMTGEIAVGNDMLFEGYTDQTSRPVSLGLMSTGDRGYLDANGRLFVVGRADDMIISGGENVYPQPVEDVLAAMPEVREAAVVGVPDIEYGQRLAAYIVTHSGADLDPGAVRDYVHQRLPRYCVPRDVLFLDELPRNATGKVLKRLLAD